MDIVERLRAYQHWGQPEEDKDLHKTAIAEMEKLRDIITHFKMENSDGT